MEKMSSVLNAHDTLNYLGNTNLDLWHGYWPCPLEIISDRTLSSNEEFGKNKKKTQLTICSFILCEVLIYLHSIPVENLERHVTEATLSWSLSMICQNLNDLKSSMNSRRISCFWFQLRILEDLILSLDNLNELFKLDNWSYNWSIGVIWKYKSMSKED